MRLVKKDQVWRLTAPLNAKADQTIVDSMLTTLARLRKERDLGEEKDLKPFGLDKPGLVVKFTAQGQPHQLAIGAKVPGDQNYYVLKDQDPHLLTISMGSKDSLDRQLLALRDKTLLAFIPGEVKGLRVKTPKTAVALEKTGPQTWRWVGRPDFRVRGDRVEKLLRDLHIARARNFLEPPPKNLAALGLVPDRQTEITVATPAGDQTLWLGAKKDDAVYARLGATGPVVLVDACPGRRDRQDPGVFRRPPPVVRGHSRRPPGRLGPPRQDLDRPERPGAWKITGPDQAATQQPAVRLEMALWNFQKLEGEPIPPPAGAPPARPLSWNSSTRPANPSCTWRRWEPGAKTASWSAPGRDNRRHGPGPPGAIPPVAGRNAAADGRCQTSRAATGER